MPFTFKVDFPFNLLLVSRHQDKFLSQANFLPAQGVYVR